MRRVAAPDELEESEVLEVPPRSPVSRLRPEAEEFEELEEPELAPRSPVKRLRPEELEELEDPELPSSSGRALVRTLLVSSSDAPLALQISSTLSFVRSFFRISELVMLKLPFI